ncbi:MAG: glycosyl transferase family 9 [Parachlamydiales bacterium]|nr:glycosyl transferase family 9 [Parachlamydiales bacterium]
MRRMSNIAVVPATGMGDGLIMLIASHHLLRLGNRVTTFSRHLPSFGRWLEDGEYRLPPDDWKQTLSSFDSVLLQYDNTPKAKKIALLRRANIPVYIFYPTYQSSKHGNLLAGFDFPFNENQTMVDNTCLGTQTLFGSIVSMNNGLKPLSGLIHRKNMLRVIIHPTSSCPDKNWPKHKFLQLSKLLQEEGYQPVFILSPEERADWPEIEPPLFSTLEDLASTIYESGFFIGNDSGPGHLASYLSIPHLIIGAQRQNMRMWRPGWHRGEIICPPHWLPNFKGLRLREQKWNFFITTKGVLKRFKSIVK